MGMARGVEAPTFPQFVQVEKNYFWVDLVASLNPVIFNARLGFYFLSSSISFGKTLKSGTTIGGPFIFIAALALVIISQKSNVSILTNVNNWL